MRVVVDTNVIAYLLIGEPELADEASNFWERTTAILAPSSWKAELANAVWVLVRQSARSEEAGLACLQEAGLLRIESVDPQELWEEAYRRALRANHPVYDTLFVELAVRESVPLATFDKAVLKKFSDVAKRPNELVS